VHFKRIATSHPILYFPVGNHVTNYLAMTLVRVFVEREVWLLSCSKTLSCDSARPETTVLCFGRPPTSLRPCSQSYLLFPGAPNKKFFNMLMSVARGHLQLREKSSCNTRSVWFIACAKLVSVGCDCNSKAIVAPVVLIFPVKVL